MLSKQKLARINELAKKSKEDTLTIKEQNEQKKLREEYIKSFRKGFNKTLLNVKVVDKEGHDVTPKKLQDEKNKKLH